MSDDTTSALVVNPGAWFVYHLDVEGSYDITPIGVFAPEDELLARRVGDRDVNRYVVWWPYGMTFDDACGLNPL